MKRFIQTMALNIGVAGVVLTGLSGPAFSQDVCSQGTSEPPFLSYGVNSNLLMLLDNSGSMLDMAYVDPDNQCFDEGYTPWNPADPNSVPYAGNFKIEIPDPNDPAQKIPAWYKWVERTQAWSSNKAYAIGEIVYANGAFYRALTAGTSGGKFISEDKNVKWEPLLRPSWKGTATYHAHSFVFDNDRGMVYYTRTGGGPAAVPATTPATDSRFLLLNGYKVPRWQPGTAFAAGTYVLSADMKIYHTKAGGTSAAGSTRITNDDGIEWSEADYQGWRKGISYVVGDLATWDGMVYTSMTSHNSSGDTLYEDGFAANWQRLDEGYFELMAGETAARDFCADAATPAHRDPAKNESFANGDMCVKINNPGTATQSQGALAFAASGDFLNWAMSSKFDIQKDILTGGKYKSEAERVVGETRGCAGNRFIKQVAIRQTAPAVKDMKITMTIRRSDQTDRVDSRDDTTRFEIYAITENGMDFSACQAAIEGFTDPKGLGPVEADVASCVGIPAIGGKLDEHTIYHKAMQACWFRSKHGDWKGGNDYLMVADRCQNIYRPDFPANPPVLPVIFPNNIGANDPYQVCYGIYDAIPHTLREGYIGRCWQPGEYTPAAGDTCQMVACDYKNPLACTSKNGVLSCYFTDAVGDTYRCAPDKKLDKCTGQFNSAQETCNKAWADVFRVNGAINGASCTPALTQSIGYWEADFNKDLNIPKNSAEETSYIACVEAGLRAYCQMIDMPEVIDPSDQASNTEEAWNLPGTLIDSGVVGQLGANPILATKGYIYQNTPPEGILHQTAEDLRIGAMAFNANGAAAECKPEVAPVEPVVAKFCPKGIKDGAEIITPIRLGSLPTGEDRKHVHDLVDAINRVRAISWTPLAEAVYNAIGYYTQNKKMRLDDNDFQIDEDVHAGWISGRKYTNGAYVLDGAEVYKARNAGIAEGGSRANDTGVQWDLVGPYKGTWTNGATYSKNDIVTASAGNKLYITYAGGTSILKDQAPSSPLYDRTVQWEPLVDPVARWCQYNHILIITEGASTADINTDISNFVAGTHVSNNKPIVDPGEAASDELASQCTDGLQGSTYLDDLIYFGRNFEDPDNMESPKPFSLYPGDNATLPTGDYPFTAKEKKSITTHIVVAGSPRASDAAGECDPQTLMNSAAYNGGTTAPLPGENPEKLKKSLLDIFNALRQRASAGSAASVISSARGGEGAIYQAIFWPQLSRKNNLDEDVSIAWAGDVHGLFLDDKGFMYEDTNGNRTLDNEDRRVIIFFDENLGRSQACYDSSIQVDGNCTATWKDDDNADRTGPIEMHAVKYLWSINDWLADNAMITNENRTDFISNEKRRHIFTWNDSNDDGIVDEGEILPFEAGVNWAGLGGGSRGNAARDFDLANNMQVDRLINWLRGNDDLTDEDANNNSVLDIGEDTNGNGMLDLPLRSRQIPDAVGSGNLITWRLGDIIHSTPMTVAAPAEGYHLIYNDFSYAQFLRRYKGRRHVVYFGANDGMLHAVNAGFYSEAEKKFCLYPLDSGGRCTEAAVMEGAPTPSSYPDAPALGAELWAYVPYNLLPHLNCLTDPDYAHKYFVDQRPRIFDVQIFEQEGVCTTSDLKTRDPGCIHPNGWGTILVGGMRFGGSPVNASDLNGVNGDTRQFTSNWFIMDITDPESEPILMGELTGKNDGTTVNLGYTVGMPTMAIMKDNDGTKWYLVFGSGPTAESGLTDADAIRGISDTTAKVSILPLEWLVTDKQPLRISPAHPSVTGNNSGTFTLDSPNGFVSDMITVDYDINPSYEKYKSDVIYFGTVEGNFGTNTDGTTFWNGGGKLYRLITKEIQSGIVPGGGDGSTYGRGTSEATTLPSQWQTNVLLDLTATTTRPDGITQPITAAPSVGTDGHNFWVYFGTGRFFDAKDKTDDTQQSYYGIKEPAVMTVNNLVKTRMLTWKEVKFPYDDMAGYPGAKGLWKVDDILVGLSSTMQTSALTCRSGGLGCLPPSVAVAPFLSNLNNFIGGTGLDTWNLATNAKTGPLQADTSEPAPPCTTNNCTDGWYRDFYPYTNRERNVGQATLLGGLVTYTTYQPYNDVCQAEGNAYLYGLYYRTGTGWHKNIFGPRGVDANNNAVEKLDLGRGLATTPNLHVGGGPDGGAKAFVQTSTGEIQEIEQDNLPISNYRTGRSNFRQCN